MTLLKNLKGGFRLAFMLRCPRAAFTPSWHSVIFVLLVSVTWIFLTDAISAGHPKYFDVDGVQKGLVYFALLFISAYAAALLSADTSKTQTLATILYNGLFFPWFLFLLLNTVKLEWLAVENVADNLQTIHWVWVFLIAFRAVEMVFDPEPLRQMLASGAVVLVLCVSPTYFYFYNFWYPRYVPAEPAEPSPLEKLTHEELFQMQDGLLRKELAALEPPRENHRDVYGVVFGSFGFQDVFMREVNFVSERLAALYGMEGRVLRLVNNEETLNELPLAIAMNLRAALAHLGRIMKKDDVLLLYLTSHGGEDGTLSVWMGYGSSFLQLRPELLAEILEESGIQNRILMISACYSGAAIDALKTDYTLMMTAAAKDRESYGCGDDSELTYFADAYFKQAFPKERDWVKAFAKAKEFVTQREQMEGMPHHSNPQIFIGENIEPVLAALLQERQADKQD